jgi:para-aminobenzoate synthetase component I
MAAAPSGWSDFSPVGGARAVRFRPDGSQPFILFDDARSPLPIRLYRNPFRIVETCDPGQVRSCLDAIQTAVDAGAHAAGFLAYNAGLALEPRLTPFLKPDNVEHKLLWFGLFETAEAILPEALRDHGADSSVNPMPAWSEPEYQRAVGCVQNYIAAGDCYQVNLTFDALIANVSDAFALYGRIRMAQRAGWGGMLSDGKNMLLSCSPELFFAAKEQQIWARPMKGTAPRSPDSSLDATMRAEFASSKKDRAENLMIVDLLRNDLSRISSAGSVQVPSLFDIESYPTVFQMTSTITARILDHLKSVDILAALFPCGSVTGAPKIRAMEIINELERPRRAYTGSMGFIEPGGSSIFNVLIRTVELDRHTGAGTLGLGSAIVSDSSAEQEWTECLTKMRFIQ